MSVPCIVVPLGKIDYMEAWDLQRRLAEEVKAGHDGWLLILEHPHSFTFGRAGNADNLKLTPQQLEERDAKVYWVDRGGDITYHGPGQIVGYPIVNLAPRKDLHAYLRFLEQVLINTVGTFGLAASRNPGKTGIWLGPRKIAAIGVGVKRWTTFHGFALNVNTDLTPFTGIVPCGIAAADGTVTSMHLELGHEMDLAEVKRVLAAEFWRMLPEFQGGRG